MGKRPNESQIVNLGLIDTTTTFNFTAQQNGTYTINFENDLPTSIQVSFSYVTNPDLSGGNNSSGPSLITLLIIVLVTAVGSVLIFVFSVAEEKVAQLCNHVNFRS